MALLLHEVNRINRIPSHDGALERFGKRQDRFLLRLPLSAGFVRQDLLAGMPRTAKLLLQEEEQGEREQEETWRKKEELEQW